MEFKFPQDFQECIDFHGHVCPGLAIGYAAVKAASKVMPLGASEDEELVAIAENDSCSVDAVQKLLSCTFGKGNLIFRDWGKQVFTFFDRTTSRGVRVSFKGPLPGGDERHALKMKIDSGFADESDMRRWHELRENAVRALVETPDSFFDVREVRIETPQKAFIVDTKACEKCGEPTRVDRMTEEQGRCLCKECSAS